MTKGKNHFLGIIINLFQVPTNSYKFWISSLNHMIYIYILTYFPIQ